MQATKTQDLSIRWQRPICTWCNQEVQSVFAGATMHPGCEKDQARTLQHGMEISACQENCRRILVPKLNVFRSSGKQKDSEYFETLEDIRETWGE